MTRTILKAVAEVTAFGAGVCWFLVFAYADWLRFIDPRSPDPASGHVVYVKALKGIFYATPAQAFWAQTLLLPIALVGAIAIGSSVYLRRTDMKSQTDGPARAAPSLVLLFRLVGYAWGATMFVLFFFGDNIMSWVFTGSLMPPGLPQ
jgi:hypothetical protein